MINWQTDNPPKHGYYLGAWLRDGRWLVSELWYNPDSIGSGWWTSRGYLDQKEKYPFKTVEVVAWMPLPEYPGNGKIIAYMIKDRVYEPEDVTIVREQVSLGESG